MNWRSGKYLKHTVPVLLLAVWALHFLYPLLYSTALLQIRQSQKEIIAQNTFTDYTEIVLTSATFKKAYNPREKELEVKGEMYDVARVVKHGGNISCYVLKDKDETSLNRSIGSELQHQQSSKNTFQAQCWWPVVLLYTSYEPQHRVLFTSEPSFHDNYKALLQEGYCNSRLQPPQFA